MTLSMVRRELETRLNTLAVTEGVPVAWQGVEFTKPASIWIEAFIIPLLTKAANVAVSRETLVGSFQVNVWSPRGKGMLEAETLAAKIVEAFPVLPKVGNVSIEQPPHVDPPLFDPGWVILPVTIRYRYEKQ